MKYATGIEEKLRTKFIGASGLWAYLYNHQGIKAALNKPNIKSELELNKMEYERELNKIKYQEYHEERGESGETRMVEGLVTALESVLRILRS